MSCATRPHVCSTPPCTSSVCCAVLFSAAAWQVCVVAHSYGTFVASAMCQRTPERIQSLALLDPVCLG